MQTKGSKTFSFQRSVLRSVHTVVHGEMKLGGYISL